MPGKTCTKLWPWLGLKQRVLVDLKCNGCIKSSLNFACFEIMFRDGRGLMYICLKLKQYNLYWQVVYFVKKKIAEKCISKIKVSELLLVSE